jgi:hypothetical protein
VVDGKAKAQAGPRRVIAVHLILTLYGHWAVNDPRGSGSTDFIDPKFAALGPIHFGRKPNDEQPTREELREFHAEHEDLLNFPTFWIDDAMRNAIAEAICDILRAHGYTCYACAICGNHIHLIIRTHKHDAETMWTNFAEGIRIRLRLRFPRNTRSFPPAPTRSFSTPRRTCGAASITSKKSR